MLNNISKLIKLKYLNLGKNFRNLIKIDYKLNPILHREIDIFRKLKNFKLLEYLFLYNTNIYYITKDITKIINLKYINLCSTCITEIPNYLSKLYKLEYIHIYKFIIKYVPKNFWIYNIRIRDLYDNIRSYLMERNEIYIYNKETKFKSYEQRFKSKYIFILLCLYI
jgi:hypothetical protein